MIPVALALTGGKPVSFTGHGRLMQRPLEPYYELFDRMGITHHLENGVLTVEGELVPGEYPLSGSVQFTVYYRTVICIAAVAATGWMCAERHCHYRPSGISCLCGYDIAGVENIWVSM